MIVRNDSALFMQATFQVDDRITRLILSADVAYETIDDIVRVGVDGDADVVDLTLEPQLPQDRLVAIADADPILEGHLSSARMDFIRYANACQDLSRPLPPWQVQALSGIGTGRLLALMDDAEASARVWRLDPASGAIVPFGLGPAGSVMAMPS